MRGSNPPCLLDVPPDVSHEALKRECNHRLRYAFESSLSESPDAIQWIAIYDPDQQLLTQLPHVNSILTNFGITAAVWCAEDVLEISPDLTYEQANAVLDAIVAKHDSTCGIGWDTLDQFAEMLYGANPDDDA